MPHQQEPLEDVTVYHRDGPPEYFRGITRDEAREIELRFGSEPSIVQIDVTPAAGDGNGEPQ